MINYTIFNLSQSLSYAFLKRFLHGVPISGFPNVVKIVEVGPRDGLQNEKDFIPADKKVHFINKLSECGLTHIEATSFVSPKWVPQMADAGAVMAGLTRVPGVSYSALTPNMQGLQKAIDSNVDEVAIFASASETFSQKNINCSIKESLKRFEEVAHAAKDVSLPLRGYVSCVVGCPYEGRVSPDQVAKVVHKLMVLGCHEVSLGDTIGVGTPGAIQSMLSSVKDCVPIDCLAIHCHDTYGQALANILSALMMGVSTIDSAVAGLGGCPYAKGASGNVATEDVLYLLDGLGIKSGVNMRKLLDASQYICDVLQRKTLSKAGMALQSKLKT